MGYILSILGIIGSFFLIKYREKVGDSLGEPDWAIKVGGIYNVVIIFAIFLFFFCIAWMTGTVDVLLSPIVSLFRSQQPTVP